MIVKGKWLTLLAAAAFFLAPINLFVKWGEIYAYVGGIFSDYLIQKLWIGELPVLLLLILWLPKKIYSQRQKILPFLKKNILLVVAVFILLARQFFTPLPIISLWYAIKVLELVLFGWCLIDIWPKISRRLMEYVLLLTVLFQAGVATLQFLRQQSLFPYRILGETQLAGSINIAQAAFAKGQTILAYGTTAHPNILAGVVVVFGLLWLKLRLTRRRFVGWQELSVIGIIGAVLFITQSYSAILALIGFLIIRSFPWLQSQARKIGWGVVLLAPLLLLALATQFTDESIFRRAFLNAHAVSVFLQQPLAGVGLGLFTTQLNNTPAQELIRFIQPVHNGLLLLLTEAGILGGIVGLLGWQRFKRRLPTEWLWLLAVLLSFDHYLVTQWVGGVMLVLVISLLNKPTAKN